jgi:thioredoxin reductase
VTTRIVVVGAGPAGLCAAAEAARLGAQVTLLDEQPEPGGQLRYRVQPAPVGPGRVAEHPPHLAQRLIAEARAAGVAIESGATVAGLFGRRELLVVRDGGARRFHPDAVVLSTGSTDLPFPFIGATLPGVFSARGLQVLLHVHRVRPGRRFAIIGGDAYAEELAGDVLLAGGEVAWSGIAPASFLRALGDDGVRELVVGQERHAVDIIAVAVGRQADPALATMAGVPLGFAAEMGGLVPLVDQQLESPVPGVFVAGDAAGIGSVDVAMAEGRLAGAAASASLGLAGERVVNEVRASPGDELAWRQSIRASRQVVAVQPYEQAGMA